MSSLTYIPTEFGRMWITAYNTARRGVTVCLPYVDINDGNIHDAIMFSQIMYWHEPSKDTGKPKLSVVIDGNLWLAKNHSDWFAETRIKASTARKCLERLRARKLIFYEVHGFAGLEAPHIRVNWEEFERRIKVWIEKNHAEVEQKDYDATLGDYKVTPDTTGQGADTTGQPPLIPQDSSNTETTSKTTQREKNLHSHEDSDPEQELRTDVRVHGTEIAEGSEKDSGLPKESEQAPEPTTEEDSAPADPIPLIPPSPSEPTVDVVGDPPEPPKAWNDLPEELTQFQDIVHALMHIVYEVVDPAEAEVMFKALNKKSKRDQAYGRVGKIASYLRDRAAEKKLVLKKAHLAAFRHWYATSDDYGGSPPLDFEKFMMAYTKFASQHNQRTKRAQQRQPEPPAPPAAPGEAGGTWVKREDWQKQQEQPDDGRQQAAS